MIAIVDASDHATVTGGLLSLVPMLQKLHNFIEVGV
jgi:hypothetical protein